MERDNLFKMNDIVFIDKGCGEFQKALFKGYISETLLLCKAKRKICQRGIWNDYNLFSI